jgi:hypothetical protein
VPVSADPLESELEELIAAGENAARGTSGAQAADAKPATTSSDSGNAGIQPSGVAPSHALTVLQRALAESRLVEEQYVQLQREHSLLRERYDALVVALRTLQDATARDRSDRP